MFAFVKFVLSLRTVSQSVTTTLLAGSLWPTRTLYSGLLFQVCGRYLCIFSSSFFLLAGILHFRTLGANLTKGPVFSRVCVVSRTLAGGSSPPPGPHLVCWARPWSQGPRGGRWEAAGARFGAQIAPKGEQFHFANRSHLSNWASLMIVFLDLAWLYCPEPGHLRTGQLCPWVRS